MVSTGTKPAAAKPATGGKHRTAGSTGSAQHAAGGQTRRDVTQVTRERAQRAAQTHRGGRTTGAAKGAAAGAFEGPEAAAAGAAGGFLTGGSKGGKQRFASDSTPRKVLVAELIVAMVIVGVSPMTDRHKNDPPATFMNRLAAVAILFMILALISTGGRGAAKVAAAFGGLVVTSLVFSNRDLFALMAKRFSTTADDVESEAPAGPPTPEEDQTVATGVSHI